jgi:propionate CoA-transferase
MSAASPTPCRAPGATSTSRRRRLVLLSALTAGGRRLRLAEGRLQVEQEGRVPRLVPAVRERTFSARAARARGATVRYVTDRCTFDLGAEGLVLSEVAPGIDPERDVLAVLPFRPRVAPGLRSWPAAVLRPGPLGLARAWAGAG